MDFKSQYIFRLGRTMPVTLGLEKFLPIKANYQWGSTTLDSAYLRSFNLSLITYCTYLFFRNGGLPSPKVLGDDEDQSFMRLLSVI